ncbi:AEC family transporter [Paenibacillus sp. IB182496]|uniref:AEC family transporter n=1 Tax=Paenibacillus sabuli TaxID=2772509 RepID=A0A927BYQ6_9BACL|nr:AEC family transporter [Paenibacillus sabuli]MBD2848050.1 AEC family transporter [Paenibacillus sabuli]
MESLNVQFMYAVMIIALGYVLKRLHVFREQDGEGLARIVFNVTLPALILSTFHEVVMDRALILLVASGFLYGVLTALLGLAVFRKQPRRVRGMLAMMVPGVNVGLFAYPLVEGIWGQEGLKYFGMFDVGNAFIVFGVCYFIGSFFAAGKLHWKSIPVKMVKSIPFMTYVTVCLLNLIGLSLPTFLLQGSAMIAHANMPMALLLLGIYLNFRFDRSQTVLLFRFIGLRYGVGLALGALLFWTLPFEPMFRYTLAISFILPVSLSALPYSVEFDYDRKFVGSASNLSIVLSFLLVWLIGNLAV